jgi:hypothetical protein
MGAPRPIGPSSGRRQHTRTSADEFALSGPSDLPDAEFNAYRKDLADVALIGRVIASHYAEPVQLALGTAAELRCAPSAEADIIEQLGSGESFCMLDDSLGWAWGYAGKDRRVGYVRSEALSGQ